MAYDPRAYRTGGTSSGSSSSSSSSGGSSGGSGGSSSHYGFIRSIDSLGGVNSLPWDQMVKAGLTPTFASNDPKLAAAMALAKSKGLNANIWIPAGGEGLPEQYAKQIVDLYKQYGPSSLVANIEQAGKGYQGSAGWDWNQRMANELQRLGVPQNLALAVLGEKDFNYGAYTGQGIHILPEDFGANTGSDLYDVDQRRNDLIQLGVPDHLIDNLLAPTQARAGKVGSVFTIDDLSPEQLAALHMGGDTGGTATVPADDGTAPSTDAVTDPASTTSTLHPPHPATPHDASDRGAIAYSKHRLAMLARTGIRPADFGLENLDPTAQWRALSTIVGARQAIQGGHAGDYQLPTNTPDQVASKVLGMIGAAHKATPKPQRAQAGVLTPHHRRFGDMQRAIHSAAGVRFLRNLGRG